MVDVFFDSREARDREYNARATVPDFTVFTRRYTELTRQARDRLAGRFDAVYDPASGQQLDLYLGAPGPSLKPIFVFIHGGYWRAFSRHEGGPMAEAFAAAGVAVASVDYALAPAASLAEMVRQCRAAVAWLWHRAAELGLDPRRIHIGGSSAGGQLVGMLLAPGWQAPLGLPQDVIAGATCLSGLFDLRPLVDSHINDWMHLDEAEATRQSPLFHLPEQPLPLLLALGEQETRGFHHQTAAYAQAWQARHGTHAAARVMTVPQRNHFDIVLDLADPAAALTRAVLAQIQASPVRPTARTHP